MDAFSLTHPERRIFAGLVVLAILGACAGPGSAMLPDISSWDSRKAVLADLEKWEFSGRIAVRTGEEGFNGKLRYSQDRRGFKATVSGPLGIGTVRLEGDDRSVILTDKDGVRTELKDAELELRYRYGWTIPVASLRYWALGIPDPAAPAEQTLSGQGQLESMVQRNWSVAISRYGEGGGQPMPRRLTAQNLDTRVRLVIDRWIFFE
ncbi:MAG: outer membrane lipoprotein LolB [Woeseiaceae bacterium]|nr:outer membrane lipoprotein LolB [Woeseiaceae bacterium]